MNTAQKILNMSKLDVSVLDRLIDKKLQLDCVNFEFDLDQNWEEEETTYTFEDGSKLINNNSNWSVK